jgi:hypothetical protein
VADRRNNQWRRRIEETVNGGGGSKNQSDLRVEEIDEARSGRGCALAREVARPRRTTPTVSRRGLSGQLILDADVWMQSKARVAAGDGAAQK